MPRVFTPDHSALDQIFTRDTNYIIPPYQRPYSWQSEGKSDRNNQINQMWDDLWTFFSEQDRDEDKEYFFGSMVIIEKKLREREVVDGQQRLTSLLLLFTAMRCFLERRLQLKRDAPLERELEKFAQSGINQLQDIVYNKQGFGAAPELKVKIERSAGYDLDQVLSLATECKSKDALPKLDQRYLEIAHRYFDNRDYFLERLEEVFLENDTFGAAQARAFDRFLAFLQTRVAIVLIKTNDFETAFSIFGILNNRGLPLSNIDLFRNFVINEFDKEQRKDSADQWYRLEREYALTEEFMGRWVESLLGTKHRKSAFNAIQERYDKEYRDTPIEKKIDRFYRDLESDLSYYSLIVEADQRVGYTEVRNSLAFIAQLGNRRYSTDFLFALFRAFSYQGDRPPEALAGLLRDYERYALWVLLRPGRRFSSTPVFEAIRQLSKGQPDRARAQFDLPPAERKELAENITGPIETNTAARLLLAAHVWREQATTDDVVEQSLDYPKATLEHIIPVSPADKTNWLEDFSDDFRAEYTQRLGNMTLLTRKMNSKVRNLDFSRKKIDYQKTHLAITRDLSRLDTISETFIKERHERIAGALCERWGLPRVGLDAG